MRPRYLVILVLLLSVAPLLLDLWAKDSDAYAQAMRFVSRDARVAALIGSVKRVDFRFWHGFSYTGDHADFSFQAISGKGSYIVDVRLRHRVGTWRVQDADILTRNGTETHIIMHSGG